MTLSLPCGIMLTGDNLSKKPQGFFNSIKMSTPKGNASALRSMSYHHPAGCFVMEVDCQ